jgi:hypothetical protein
MIRRRVLGLLATAAFVGGTMAVGTADPAQAQLSECRSWMSTGSCFESRFNENPDPTDTRPAPQMAIGQQPVQAAVASQAAPQTQAQPAGEE